MAGDPCLWRGPTRRTDSGGRLDFHASRREKCTEAVEDQSCHQQRITLDFLNQVKAYWSRGGPPLPLGRRGPKSEIPPRAMMKTEDRLLASETGHLERDR